MLKHLFFSWISKLIPKLMIKVHRHLFVVVQKEKEDCVWLCQLLIKLQFFFHNNIIIYCLKIVHQNPSSSNWIATERRKPTKSLFMKLSVNGCSAHPHVAFVSFNRFYMNHAHTQNTIENSSNSHQVAAFRFSFSIFAHLQVILVNVLTYSIFFMPIRSFSSFLPFSKYTAFGYTALKNEWFGK